MRIRSYPLWAHFCTLLLFGVGLIALLMLPVWITGFPFDFPRLWGVREFLATGIIPSGDGRLNTLFLSLFHAWIPLEHISGWSLINAAVFALSLIPWWLSVVKLFNVRVAWVSTVIIAFLPLYWLEVYYVRGYTLAILFLFLSFAIFAWMSQRSRIGALVCSGIFFGAAVACKDAFITFLPWYVLAYLWLHRVRWKGGLKECVLFLVFTFIAYSAPVLPQLLASSAPLPERVMTLFPFLERAQVSGGHFYPDLYTEEFEKGIFEAKLQEDLPTMPFLERMRHLKYALRFGIGNNVLSSLGSGVWLLLNQLPFLVHQDTVGGFFLWLFIIPGGIVLYRQKQYLFWMMVGLMASMEVLIRFILHFQRMHLMNTAWVLALFAGIGLVEIVEQLGKGRKHQVLLILISMIIAGQLLQTNRKQLARLYAHSEVPWILAQAEVLKGIPEDSIVAHPLGNQPFYLADRKYIGFRSETVDRLIVERKLPEVFTHYGVTHVMGFENDLTQRTVRSVPKIKTIPLASKADAKIDVTPWMNYVLHLFR